MQQHFMLDFETLDTVPTAVVRSMAIVCFSPETGKIYDKKKVNFRIVDQKIMGRTISDKTMEWWLSKGVTPADIILSQGHERLKNLFYILQEFIIKNAPGKDTRHIIWCRGTDFDISICKNILINQIDDLWKHDDVRDLRTLVKLFPEEQKAVAKPEKIHDPEVDCLNQIEILARIWNRIKPTGE